MSNVIVVSNREPYEHNSVDGRVVCQRTDGGLVSALDPVLSRLGGTWVAWGSGVADQEVPGQVDGLPVPPDSPAYRLRRVWLEPYSGQKRRPGLRQPSTMAALSCHAGSGFLPQGVLGRLPGAEPPIRRHRIGRIREAVGSCVDP